MPVSDNDLQVLEEWLDGELAEAQAEALRRRLSMEPELSAAMDRLRGDRQLRSRFFTVLEPSEQEVETLVAGVRREVRREELWASRVRGLKRITAVAASIVIVFMAGWVSRERLQVGPGSPPGQMAGTTVSLPSNPDIQIAGRPLGWDRIPYTNSQGATGRVNRVVNTAGRPRGDERPQVYVVIMDPSGKFLVVPNVDPAVLQRNNPVFNRLQLVPVLPPSQSQGQGVLVNDQRPAVR